MDEPAPTARTEELAREYRAAAGVLLERLGGRRMAAMLRDVDSPGALADTAGWWPDLAIERKVELLETIDVDERLERVTAWVKEALAETEVADRIRSEVADGMEKTQREFLLRQQLAAIRKELGEGGDDEDLAEDYRAKLAELDVPSRRPRRRSSARSGASSAPTSRRPSTAGSAPGSTPCSSVPWGVRSDDDLDLAHARAVLDADHTGLDEVKDRIVEELAVRKLRLERHARARRRVGRRGRRRGHPRQGVDHRPGRSARRRQDLARRVGGPGARPQVRPRRARAASATRPRSVAIAAPTWAPGPAASSAPSARPAP